MKPDHQKSVSGLQEPAILRTRNESGRAGAGVLAAALFLIVAACALGYYLFRGTTGPSAKASGEATVTASIHDDHSSGESTHPENDGERSDMSNRQRIVPGTNMAPPTVDYQHNLPDAASRSQGSGGYGSDVNGGGSTKPY